MNPLSLFSIKNKIAVITGGAGLLGREHAHAIALAGGIPVIFDVLAAAPIKVAKALTQEWGTSVYGYEVDITNIEAIKEVQRKLSSELGRIDILINNAANNPKMDGDSKSNASRFETFSLEAWNQDLAVGLTGAFLCCQVFGAEMAHQGSGVIVNIASDLSLISPDQRLYRKPDLPDQMQPVKPVTYSVVKSGIIGLTRYLATYWADRGVRVNALSPGGVFTGQDAAFVQRLTSLIPLGRMATPTEYQAAIIFLCSEASAYMTGNNLVMDGGRTCW
ncbi:MAG: SDR family oxidoreductase [Chthoniobacterales bacterium]|nr:SDR family oxidoreductase [Chthoniobacterales bacterium]